jgi:cobalt-zinc-cadmium efflux system protein
MTAATELKRQYGIGHVTLQIEISQDTACHLAPDHVV